MRVIHLSHPGRPLYEENWLGLAAGPEMLTVTSLGSRHAAIGSTVHLELEQPIIGKIFGSTASIARYRGLDQLFLDHADVVVTLELYSTTTEQGFQIARRSGSRLVVIVYELIDSHPIYRLPPFRRIARMLAKSGAAFVGVSGRAASHLKSHGVPASSIEIVRPGVDTNVFRPPSTAADIYKLLFIGRLAPHKGLPEVLHAFEEVSVDLPDLRLTVVGDGPMRAEVMALSRRNSKVQYLGTLSPQEVALQLREHSVYLAPSTDTYRLGQHIGAEQYSFGVVEALASGLAVVASVCGALPEVVPRGNPIVPQHDSRAIADAIRSLLFDEDALRDIQRYNRMSALRDYSSIRQGQRLFEVLAGFS